MLIQRDGCVFVEWERPLFHSMSLEHFKTMITTSSFYFGLNTSFYDDLEGVSAPSQATDQDAATRETLTVDSKKDFFFYHCWYASDAPSIDMFSGNGSSPKHIIIKTSFRALFESVIEEGVFAGKVAYRYKPDFEDEGLSDFAINFIKSSFYRTEEEFRLLIRRENKSEADPDLLPVRVELATLIEKVFLRKTEKDKMERVENLVRFPEDHKTVELL